MPSVFDVANREHTKFSEETGAKNVILYDSDGNEITSFGGVDPVGIKNASEATINPATEEKQDNILAELQQKLEAGESINVGNLPSNYPDDTNYPAGSGSNGSVTLTNADTAYAVPSSAPTEKYVLVLYNGSDTDIYWGYENSNSNGIILEAGEKVSLDLGANQQIYCYCGSAGKVITYSYKEVA